MEFAKQLKESIDIVQVVGGYVRLKKAGATNWSGLCPFHSEKTGSFSVNPSRGMYKCFGCGVAGDVIKFIQEIERITFWEAVKLLAEQFGIPLPKRSGALDDAARVRAALYRMHEIAQETFAEGLRSSAGAEARAYLTRRGLSDETSASFGLGYSPASGQALLRRFQQEGFTEEQLRESGLTREREGGGFYDAFRNRLMFPIHSESGKIIGFGGRALNDEDQPKYLNSKDTQLYNKRMVLYNLNRAKETIRQSGRVVLVEGYMDVIGVAAAGFRDVVASCGTALVNTQVQAIKRHCDQVLLNFDPDSAGVRATAERIPLLLSEHLKIRVVDLEGGLDPDEYIRQRGAEEYATRLNQAANYFHWLADQARRKFGTSAEGRVEALKSLLPALTQIPDGADRLAMADELASLMGLSAEDRVRSGLRDAARSRQSKVSVKAQEQKLPALDRMLLESLLASEEAREMVLPRLAAAKSRETMKARAIFDMMIRMAESGAPVDFEGLEGRLDEVSRALLHELISTDEIAGQGDQPAAHLDQALSCLESLEAADRERNRQELKSRIAIAERRGNLEQALELMMELQAAERR